jgi:hypothetical protein
MAATADVRLLGMYRPAYSGYGTTDDGQDYWLV